MRLLAIGDIHGCIGALKILERQVPFAEDDVIVSLGDYVDRGPDSRLVIDWLVQRQRAGTLISLLGNHEDMMLKARDNIVAYGDWLNFGARETLESYGGDLAKVPDDHWQFLSSHCRKYYETEAHIFVHSTVHPHIPLKYQTDLLLLWEAVSDPPPHESGKRIICGHIPQKDGRPRISASCICIDTWAYGGGWLTCLEPSTNKCWQARENGEFRMLELD